MIAPVSGTPPSARTRYLILALRNATLRNFVANVIAQERPADIAAPLAELLNDRSDFLRATAAQSAGRSGRCAARGSAAVGASGL